MTSPLFMNQSITPTEPNDLPSLQKKSKSASDLVFQGILRELEAHTLVPGQRLVEVDLAAHFGVGRNSVREALQRLAAEGVIELSRHKGAAIRSLSLQETLDVLDVAERMLGLLARTAIRGLDLPLARGSLQDTLQQLRQADQAQDNVAFARVRRRFYRVLLDMGGNLELKRLFPTILMPVVHAQHRLPSLQKMRLADYQHIAQAVLDGDPDQAEMAACAHVHNVRKSINGAYGPG
ncbi:GntR family transcriptional regulator [Bordetella tumulicola]